MARLRFLERAQWWDTGRLLQERDRRFERLIQVAYSEVPFYRRLMDAAGVRPEQLRTVSAIGRLPVVTKSMLRAGYPHETTRDTRQRTFESRTSGSTGENFCTKLDADTVGSYRACFLLAVQWAGWRFGEPHMQTGMTMTRSLDRLLKDRLLGCHYVSAADLTDSAIDAHLVTLERKRIHHLWGYPGSLYYIARRALAVGWNRPLKSVVTWGDNLYPTYRETIEKAFSTRVTDTYGCAEGIQIAAQCGHSTSYHVHSLDTVVEIVDEDGNPVPPGGTGSILLTRLHPGPMPLIRYKVGDVGTAATERACPCGRGYVSIAGIQGRETDVVLTPSGNRLIVHFFTGILEHFSEIESFQVLQEDINAIVLRLVPRGDLQPEVQREIVRRLQARGADLRIDIELVSSIPISRNGKRRFVIGLPEQARQRATAAPSDAV